MTTLRPMLAETAVGTLSDDDWWFEPKLDGIRALAELSEDRTRLWTRNGREVSGAYPEFADLHRRLAARDAVVDGEIVAFSPDGRDSFEALQRRMHVARPGRAQTAIPVAFIAFDLLRLDGSDVTDAAFEERRTLLERSIRADGTLQLVLQVRGQGERMIAAAHSLGLEGVMAKRVGSPYRPGRRSSDWQKLRFTQRDDFAILGWVRGRGGADVGSLLLGERTPGGWRFAGRVGSGLTAESGAHIVRELRPFVRTEPALDELRAVAEATFVEPRVVASVEYRERTSSGKLRQPVFKGLRDDLAA